MVELLLVLAVLAILAGLALPAASRTKVQSQIQQARLQERQIVSALVDYQSVYGRFPASLPAQEATALANEDLTYGGFLKESQTWLAGPCYSNYNSELMPALLGRECFGDGTPSFNYGHVQNPSRARFLEAGQPGGTNANPGIGIDGIYRDPWRSPYIVTLDLNGDGLARDIMYRNPAVSQDPKNPGRGVRGLLRIASIQGEPVFEAPGPVLVWSAGPDRHLNTRLSALEGPNRDNILSCGF